MQETNPWDEAKCALEDAIIQEAVAREQYADAESLWRQAGAAKDDAWEAKCRAGNLKDAALKELCRLAWERTAYEA